MNLIEEFQKRASAAGLSKEQISSFMADAGLAEKTAAGKPDDFFSAYIAGIYENAAAYGLTEEQATSFLRKSAGLEGFGGKALGLGKKFLNSPVGGASMLLGAQQAPKAVGAADSALASRYSPLNALKQWIESNPQLAGGLGGGVAGGALGAMSGIPGSPGEDGQPDDNNVLRNALLGALAGGGAGAGAGHFAANPDMFKQLPA